MNTQSFTHELKTLTEYFEPVRAGIKRFEVRKNDRDFKVGDKLLLRDYDGANYIGRNVLVEVDYIFYGGNFGLISGACIMSFKILEFDVDVIGK